MNAALQAVTDANKAVMFYNGSDEQTAGMDYATLLKARKYAKEQHEIAKKNLAELTNKLQAAEAQKKREKDTKLNRMK